MSEDWTGKVGVSMTDSGFSVFIAPELAKKMGGEDSVWSAIVTPKPERILVTLQRAERGVLLKKHRSPAYSHVLQSRRWGHGLPPFRHFQVDAIMVDSELEFYIERSMVAVYPYEYKTRKKQTPPVVGEEDPLVAFRRALDTINAMLPKIAGVKIIHDQEQRKLIAKVQTWVDL